MNDGVIYEKGNDRRKVRAVVMRQGVMLKSKWSGTKEGALRSLVVSLSTMWAATDTAFNAVCDEYDKDQLMLAEDHRPIIADILEGLGGRIITKGDSHALLSHINGREIISMNHDMFYRGAATLRWTAKREAQ